MKSGIRNATVLSAALAAAVASLSGCWGDSDAQSTTFTLSSPDLLSGTFATAYILNGFGCTGGNLSPELQWFNVPAGTKSLALQMYDPDAPTGSGFWHWAVYDIPPTATGLARGVGNNAALLPRRRVRRQHRLPRHGRDGSQRQLRRSLPARGRSAASLHLHAVRAVGRQGGGGGGRAEDRHGGSLRLRAEQGSRPRTPWQGDVHRDLRPLAERVRIR